MRQREERKTERGDRETERQTGKWSELCLFFFRVTGSDLVAGWPITGGSDKSNHFGERPQPAAAVLMKEQSDHNSMVTGLSRNLRNSASHCAPTAPSTTRWSQLSVTDIMLATSNLRNPNTQRQIRVLKCSRSGSREFVVALLSRH